MKPKPKFKVKILGDSWNIYCLEQEEYAKFFGEDSEAVTVYDHGLGIFNIVFSARSLKRSTVAHELVHAFRSYQYTDSAGLNEDQHEEVMCDLIAYRGQALQRLTNSIWSRLRRYSK